MADVERGPKTLVYLSDAFRHPVLRRCVSLSAVSCGKDGGATVLGIPTGGDKARGWVFVAQGNRLALVGGNDDGQRLLPLTIKASLERTSRPREPKALLGCRQRPRTRLPRFPGAIDQRGAVWSRVSNSLPFSDVEATNPSSAARTAVMIGSMGVKTSSRQSRYSKNARTHDLKQTENP